MVNHVRTLLLNADGALGSDDPGEQYTPPAFKPLVLPTYLQTARRCLFGAAPDRAYMNYRLAQYMSLLHATELKQYVLAMDERVTYTAEAGGSYADLFNPATFVPTSQGEPPLVFDGSPSAPDAYGQSYFNYTLTPATLTGVLPRRFQTFITLGGGPQFSDPVVLPGSGYTVLVPLTAPDSATWYIEIYNRPQQDPGQVLATADLS